MPLLIPSLLCRLVVSQAPPAPPLVPAEQALGPLPAPEEGASVVCPQNLPVFITTGSVIDAARSCHVVVSFCHNNLMRVGAQGEELELLAGPEYLETRGQHMLRWQQEYGNSLPEKGYSVRLEVNQSGVALDRRQVLSFVLPAARTSSGMDGVDMDLTRDGIEAALRRLALDGREGNLRVAIPFPPPEFRWTDNQFARVITQALMNFAKSGQLGRVGSVMIFKTPEPLVGDLAAAISGEPPKTIVATSVRILRLTCRLEFDSTVVYQVCLCAT